MTPAPHPELTVRPIDRLLDAFSLSALLVLWGYVIITYRELPTIIPIHFNFHNEPDNYGSKITLFTMPVVATLVFILLSVLIRIPQKLNYPVKITDENAVRQYRYSTLLLRYMKLVIPLTFLIMSFEMAQAVKNIDPYIRHSVPISIAFLLLPLPVYIYFSVKNKG
jgi:uncharacterized membrane protein